jgi:hypothetical protein
MAEGQEDRETVADVVKSYAHGEHKIRFNEQHSTGKPPLVAGDELVVTTENDERMHVIALDCEATSINGEFILTVVWPRLKGSVQVVKKPAVHHA